MTSNATEAAPTPTAEVAPKTPTKAPAAKKAAPAKKAPAKKATAVKAPAAKRAPAAVKVMSSTDAKHQKWQGLKRELTAVMSDLLYDSRRVTPDHAKSREEATAKVTAALKVLSEFTESIRIK